MKNLIKLLDLSQDEIMKILDTAVLLKQEWKLKREHDFPAGKVLGMIFRKNSTRTRVSFEAGIFHLKGHGIFLSQADSQIGRGEPIEDTARVLSRYCDCIMIRTHKHEEIEKLAEFSTVPVINGLTDFSHPCQVLADFMTIIEHKKTLKNLKICYIGDGNNMANSIIVGGLKCGLEVSVACPLGYEPTSEVLEFASTFPNKFVLTSDPLEAITGVDVVFTDVWTSMGFEEEIELRKKAFKNYVIDEALIGHANKNCMIQHCLPVHRGEEIAESVFERHAKEIFDEAENRLHVQKAIMYLLMKN